jgi:hypothetical protein
LTIKTHRNKKVIIFQKSCKEASNEKVQKTNYTILRKTFLNISKTQILTE